MRQIFSKNQIHETLEIVIKMFNKLSPRRFRVSFDFIKGGKKNQISSFYSETRNKKENYFRLSQNSAKGNIFTFETINDKEKTFYLRLCDCVTKK